LIQLGISFLGWLDIKVSAFAAKEWILYLSNQGCTGHCSACKEGGQQTHQ